jgi:hypothetical protein
MYPAGDWNGSATYSPTQAGDRRHASAASARTRTIRNTAATPVTTPPKEGSGPCRCYNQPLHPEGNLPRRPSERRRNHCGPLGRACGLVRSFDVSCSGHRGMPRILRSPRAFSTSAPRRTHPGVAVDGTRDQVRRRAGFVSGSERDGRAAPSLHHERLLTAENPRMSGGSSVAGQSQLTGTSSRSTSTTLRLGRRGSCTGSSPGWCGTRLRGSCHRRLPEPRRRSTRLRSPLRDGRHSASGSRRD